MAFIGIAIVVTIVVVVGILIAVVVMLVVWCNFAQVCIPSPRSPVGMMQPAADSPHVPRGHLNYFRLNS